MTRKALRGEFPTLKPAVPLTDPGSALRQRLPHLDIPVWLLCPKSPQYCKERTQILITGFGLRSQVTHASTNQPTSVEFPAVRNSLSDTAGDTSSWGLTMCIRFLRVP